MTVLDLNNKIHWHSSQFTKPCSVCKKEVTDGFQVWNNKLRHRVFVCDPCYKKLREEL